MVRKILMAARFPAAVATVAWVFVLGVAVLESHAFVPPHLGTIRDGFRYGFPPNVEQDGLVFAGHRVPISRDDVRRRIVSEINYLLLDRRSRIILWLERADALRPIIAPILSKCDVPPETIYLAAIESSYNPRSLSSAGAYGFWQFMAATAKHGPNTGEQYDWKMKITPWADERADLVKSTYAAARYLGWLQRVRRVTLSDGKELTGFGNWFLTVASYNAGPKRVSERLNDFGEKSYWNVALPVETERYVPRWIAVGLISKYRKYYGVEVPKQSPPAFETIEDLQLKKDLSIATLAKLIKSTPRKIWMLNSEINLEKAVFPAKSGRNSLKHTIKVPKGTRTTLLSKLAEEGYVKK